MDTAIPWIIGTGITLLGLGAAGFWAVWTRAADARSKLRDQLEAAIKEERGERMEADKELADKIDAGERLDSQRDSSLAVLVETSRRMEVRLDQLAGKFEAHMAGEAGGLRRVLDEWGRSELPKLIDRAK